MAGQKWNYRVIKSGTETDTFFSVQEVYYGEDDNEKDYSHTLDCTPNGNSIDEIKTSLERMLKCLEKPILDEIPVDEADTEEELPEVVYYESLDGGRTLQVVDLDEDEGTEETEEESSGDLGYPNPDGKSDEWDNQQEELESKNNTKE